MLVAYLQNISKIFEEETFKKILIEQQELPVDSIITGSHFANKNKDICLKYYTPDNTTVRIYQNNLNEIIDVLTDWCLKRHIIIRTQKHPIGVCEYRAINSSIFTNYFHKNTVFEAVYELCKKLSKTDEN